MLTSTYIHIKEINYKTEQILYGAGYGRWWDILKNPESIPLSEKQREHLIREINFSIKHFMKDNLNYFADKLKHKDLWRIIKPYFIETGFLDIETSKDGEITVVGLYIGEKYLCYKMGDNTEKLEWMLSLPKVIVTFNGMIFDVPVIKRHFPYIKMTDIHFDLLKGLPQVGWKGGLKKLEKNENIHRPERIAHMTGYDAVKLWEKYSDGDSNSLELLIEYNLHDVKNLKILMERYLVLMEKNLLSGEKTA